MNKRLEKIVAKLQNGERPRLRRDQVEKAIIEGGFDYFIHRGYDEVYNVEPVKLDAKIENISSHWLKHGTFYNAQIVEGKLKIDISYGYSYMHLYADIQEVKEEVAPVQVENVEFTMEESTHTKTGEVIYLVKLTKKVSKEEFNAIRDNIKKLGGYYSRFVSAFVFKDEESAKALVTPVCDVVEEVATTEEIEENIIDATDFNDIETLKTVYINNWNELPQDLQTFILSCDKYWIDLQEIILYKGRKAVASLGINGHSKHNINVVSGGAYELFQWNNREGYTKNNLPKEKNYIDDNITFEFDGECQEKFNTNSIEEATNHFNSLILDSYSLDGGYNKTFIKVNYEEKTFSFRFDLNSKVDTTENILLFIIEDSKMELDYLEKNIHELTWIKDKEKFISDIKELISDLEGIYSSNDIKVSYYNPQRTEAMNSIVDTNLYQIDANEEQVLKDSRYIKNNYFNGVVVVFGTTLKDLIYEGVGIDPLNIKEYKCDIESFMEGLYKVDNGLVINLIPTEMQKELQGVKMLNRFNIERCKAYAKEIAV